MQLKDVTPIIKAILEERDKIPLLINTERYIPNWQPNLNGNAMRGGIRKALRAIEQAPVVDAEPVVHAARREVVVDGKPCWQCMACKMIHSGQTTGLLRYCSHCGARYTEVQHE